MNTKELEVLVGNFLMIFNSIEAQILWSP